jgi:hypothetical protein
MTRTMPSLFPLQNPLAAGGSMGYNQPIVNRTRALGLALTVALLVAGGGCGHKIGDSCTTSADCDPTSGTRTCDLSQPGGYCILEGCDARSCPSDSVCARFFPEPPLLSVDPATVCDPTVLSTPTPCTPDEICLPDPTGTDAHSGVCVRTALEKRVCVESCGGNGDCRGGYECRLVASCGSLPLTLDPTQMPKFCAPVVQPADGGGGANGCSLNTTTP